MSLQNHIPRQRTCLTCLGLLLVALSLSLITAKPVAGQVQAPLTLEQVRDLISIGAPDATVAHEIQTRGLAFTPDHQLLQQLEKQRAGAKTLAAVRDLVPMLDDAKKQIPGILQTIYSALDQGNPSAVHVSVSNEVENNSAKLDAICKPFTYRAHYIEAITERPNRRYEVRTHVLFKPLDERAYVLWFGVSGGTFQLQDVTDPPDDWFQPQLKSAEEVVRKFVYAVNAGRTDVEQQIVTPSLSARLGSSKTLSAIQSSQISQVSTQQLRIQYYKGFKIGNEIWVHETGKLCCATYTFLLEPIQGALRIVAWTSGRGGDSYEVEDPALEYATLTRFGIAATPPALVEASNVQQSSPVPQAAQPASEAGVQRFNVRHRHMPGFIVTSQAAGQISYCTGILTVDHGAVQYYCTQPDVAKNRCDRVTISDIRKVKYQGNGLRVVARGGSWDFFFDDQSQLAAAHDAISAILSAATK